MVSQRVIPSVMVGKKEQGAFGPAKNKGVHVGEFRSVWNCNRFNDQIL